jgi:signal transduction histidine kinase
MVEGAPGALGQALDVLLSNAARHGRGTVTVTVAPTDVWVELLVSDEGRMDIDQADALFIQRDQGGPHGIGLRLARRLVESEGGTIDVVSPNPTTLRIRLPLASANTHDLAHSETVGSSTT